MLTLEDCIALCGLSEAEVEAIAEHEHLPEIAAVEMAEYLLHCDDGEIRIKRMIVDDLEAAKARGDADAIERYEGVLKHFIAHHPRVKG